MGKHSSIRWGLVCALILGALLLVVAAPFATPLSFARDAFGTNGWSAVRDLSPFNRDIQYLILITAGILVCAACAEIGEVKPAALYAIGAKWAERQAFAWMLVVLTALLSGCVAFGSFASAYMSRELPLHEGEWLGYLFDSGPYLHGWIINVLPTKACYDLAYEGQIVGCARVVRIAWACIAYATLPFIFYLLFRYDRPRIVSAVLSIAAMILFALVDHKLYGFYFSGFEPLSTAPVRGTSLLFVLAAAAFTGRIALKSLPPWWAMVLGFSIPLSFLGNILSGPMGIALAAAVVAVVGLARGWRDGLKVTLYIIAGFAIGVILLMLAVPEVLATSWESFRYFSAVGRNNFADETPWLAAGSRTTLLMRYAEIPLYAGTIALTMLVTFQALRRGQLRDFVLGNLPALLIALFSGMTFIFVTGVAVSAFGLALLCPFLVLRYIPWQRLFHVAAAGQSAGVIAWPYLAATIFLLVSIGVATVSSTYFGLQAARAELATPDERRSGFGDAIRLRTMLDTASQRCMVSLTSDGTLLLATRRPSCLSRHQPVYASKVSEQDRAIAELDRLAPRYVHVTSDVIDNPYVIQSHAPRIWRYVQAHYRPAFILDGRWFWERAPKSVGPWRIQRVGAIVGRITRLDREAVTIEWPIAVGGREVGIALRCADGKICALGVATAGEEHMVASLKTPFPAAGGNFDVLLWQPDRSIWTIIAKAPPKN